APGIGNSADRARVLFGRVVVDQDLSFFSLDVTGGGAGTVNQPTHSVNIGGFVSVGWMDGAGNYVLDGGSLLAQSLTIGWNNGTGEFTQSGGIVGLETFLMGVS